MKRTQRFAGLVRRVVLGGVFGASLLLGARLPATATVAIFLDVPGIPGEATFPPAVGQIDVISFSTGVGPAKAPKSSSAYGVVGLCAAPPSKPVLSSFCLVKNVDMASPKLFLAAAKGTLFPAVTVSLYKVGLGSIGSTTPYAVYVLSNAIVSSVQHGALSPSDLVPTETVCFNFDKTQISVAPVDAAGGVGTPVVVGFDACLGASF